MDLIRNRYCQILGSITNCHDKGLLVRLYSEKNKLISRKEEIFKAARSWKNSNQFDQLSIEFLIEITSRPLITSNS